MKSFLADVSDLIPPTVMAILFVCLVVTILRVQNPQRRAASKQREEDAERSDPRIIAEQPSLWQAAKAAKKESVKKEKETAARSAAANNSPKIPAPRQPHPASGPAVPGDPAGPDAAG
jgi:hypothetical protein